VTRSSITGRCRVALAALMFAVFAVFGCAPAQQGDLPGTAPHRDRESMRTVILAELTRSGHTTEANLVKNRGAGRLTRVPTSFLRSWQIVRLEYFRLSNPVTFYMAVGDSQARLLTENPAGFNQATAAAGTRLDDNKTAAELARIYLETTRTLIKRSYVIDRADSIRFLPEPSKEEKRRRNQIVKEYRNVIRPPQVTRSEIFTVTAYVVRDRELQRRTLNISRSGMVLESTQVLATDLPVPHSS
jgi:hypothetical protein